LALPEVAAAPSRQITAKAQGQRNNGSDPGRSHQQDHRSERKHRHLLTRRNASITPLTLAFGCRCVSVAAGWLQGIRRLFAACWLG
jgi:hypothetical protein